MRYTVEQSVDILRRTPGVLRALLQDANDAWVFGNYGPETFSPFDVIGHLINGERTDWIPRIKIILEHGESKSFPPFDRFSQFEENKGKTIGELLDAFESLREMRIRDLKTLNLNENQLAMRGMHPALGTVTLENLLATWVAHDLNHIAQIVRAMAYQYREEVGPWREYLRVLKD